MYCLFILGSALALILPRNACYVIARFLALLHFYLSKKDRISVNYNLLPIIKDDKQRRKCVKEVFINFSYYLVDFFRYPKLDSNFIKRYVRVSGLDNLKTALAQGKGVIALTAHLGNYELAGAVTSFLGYPVAAVALPHRDRRVNNFFDARRHMVGIEVIPTGTAVRGCFSALRAGKLLALLGDKDFAGGGIKVTLFSCSAYIPRGAAFFALKTGAPIIPAFFVREDRNFYRLIFEKPIIYKTNEEETEVAIIKQYTPILEHYLKKYPGQWYIFEKYWLEESFPTYEVGKGRRGKEFPTS